MKVGVLLSKRTEMEPGQTRRKVKSLKRDIYIFSSGPMRRSRQRALRTLKGSIWFK